MRRLIFLFLGVLVGMVLVLSAAGAEECPHEPPVSVVDMGNGEELVRHPPPKERVPSYSLTNGTLSDYQKRWWWQSRDRELADVRRFALSRCAEIVRENIDYGRANDCPN
jgi:hypothetical protein